MYSNFKPFLDRFGLIAQKDTSGADGGDSAHRFGIAWACLKLLGKKFWLDGLTDLDVYYSYAMSGYESSPNTYRRHCDPEKWYSNPLNFSRDQTKELMGAMLVRGDSARMTGVMIELVTHGFFHKNIYPNHAYPNTPEYKMKVPDFVNPSQIGDWLRSFNSKLLYPVICFFDLSKLLDIYFARKDDEASKARGKRTDYYTMLVMDVIISRATYDTFVLRYVAKKLKETDYRSAIEWIFGPLWEDPPLHELILPLADKFIEDVG